MFKKMFGISIIVILFGIVIYNVIDKYITEPSKESEAYLIQEDGVGLIPENSTGFELGDSVVPFELETLSGDKFNLADLEGKKFIINFWASWCGPCKDEMPDMQKFYDKNKDEIEIIAINMTGKETSLREAEKFIAENNITFPVLLDRDLAISTKFSVFAIPTSYFVGTDMTFQLNKKIGPMTYNEMKKILKELD